VTFVVGDRLADRAAGATRAGCVARAHAPLRPSAMTMPAAARAVLPSVKIFFPEPRAPAHRVQDNQHRQNDERDKRERVHLILSPCVIVNNETIRILRKTLDRF
jgi:hypothetical protein